MGLDTPRFRKEREDFVEERAVAKDTGDALEPVPLAEKGIDDVDLAGLHHSECASPSRLR
jgi:hypothetical protein